MKVRPFLVLCVITVAMVAAAAAVVLNNQPATTVGASEKLFPGLLDTTDTLAVITLRDSDSTWTLEKSDADWGLKEHDGYPVRADAIRDLVLRLAGLEKVEAKTENPGLYSRLAVEDVDTEGARSTEVELLNDEGAVLVRLLVGKSAFGVGEEGGLYVRKPDQSRSWLVRGRLAPGLEARDWVDRRITDIPEANVRAVRIVHPDGETVYASKQTIEDEHFSLEGLTEASTWQTVRAVDDLASVLSGLNLEDLKKADDIPFADDATIRATVSTFDDLTVAVDLTEHNGRDWIRVNAETTPDAPPGEPEAARTARDIEDHTHGWAYQVSAFAVAPWKKRKSDLLNPEAVSGS